MHIGILGAGQLGRMIALSGIPLEISFLFLDPSPNAPASAVGKQVVADYTDRKALRQLAETCNRITYEFENVPVASALYLEELGAAVSPPPIALQKAQDRLIEKQFFRSLGIATPPFESVTTYEELVKAVEAIGLPAVLKTRRFGYDGKGQVVIRSLEEISGAWQAIAQTEESGFGLILEGFVPFDRELSIVAVRASNGAMAFYPLVENHHEEGILRLSLAPAPHLELSLQAEAEEYASRVLHALKYVGVLAIEFFEQDGNLLANEMAPRVHNSGHWTIEGAETSQFENHLRAVCGFPLGKTTARGHSVMINLIGTRPPPEAVLSLPNAHLHLYGKTPRAGRKLGHITLRADNREELDALLNAIRTNGLVPIKEVSSG